MPIERIRLTQAARDQLITLKRRTGITALERAVPMGALPLPRRARPAPGHPYPGRQQRGDGLADFAGARGDDLWGLLRQRCHADGLPLDEDTLAHQFRLHLHRGIGYLVGDPRVTDITGLVSSPWASMQHDPASRGTARHGRAALSRPLAWALDDGVLDPGGTVFDYGCGRGDDLHRLTALGIAAQDGTQSTGPAPHASPPTSSTSATSSTSSTTRPNGATPSPTPGR